MRQSLKWLAWKKNDDTESKKDYGKYEWTVREIFYEGGKAIGIIIVFSWFFYRSIWAVPFFCLLAVLFIRRRSRDKKEEAKKQLVLQFQECIRAVSASLQAGYSVENAFKESRTDMLMMFGKDSFICRELSWIQRGLVVNLTLEELLSDLGRRSRSQEIQEFAEVFTIAKRNGGSIPEIISTSVEVIGRREETEEEIHTQMAARKLEQKVMNIMPFGILIYIESSSPGYFEPLYHNFMGIIIMSGCLCAYLSACVLSERILKRSTAVWGDGVGR